MDEIKEFIENIVEKLQEDKDLLAQFKKQPIKVVESLLGVDLPDEAFDEIIAGVKAKISIDDAKDKIEDAKDMLGGILNKFKK